MRNLGWNRKRDAIEREVIQVLEACGWAVLRLSVKDGPDLAMARGGQTVLIEVKSGTKGKLKPGQQAWLATWPGRCAVLRSVQEAEVYATGRNEGSAR